VLPVIRAAGANHTPVTTDLRQRKGHVVVAGAGAVGRSAVRELLRQGAEVVVVDRAQSQLALIEADADASLARLGGDLSQRQTLTSADLATARGFITALQPLRDNLFLAANVHHMNAAARVVARVGSPAEGRRLSAVGAAVVNPGEIGGVHMAQRAIHPELVEFARGLEASWDHPEQLAVVPIERLPERARRLEDLAVHARTGALVLGQRRRASGAFTYHPAPAAPLRVGGALLALGEPAELERLRALVAAAPAPILVAS
jgi:Trk K+ transport system NAD-binding subunit